jgi:peroxiredoxin family protein/TusA-related sulfurtransferase
LRDRINELDKDKMIFIYCAVGLRGYVAARLLQQHGFENVKNLSGGLAILNAINYMPNSMLLKNILGTKDTNSEDGEKSGDNEMKRVNSIDVEKISLNCSGLQCPGPIMKVFETIKTMNHGDLMEVTSTDMGFAADVSEWCKRTGNTLVDIKSENKVIVTTIMKGLKEDAIAEETGERTDKSMVIFSGELDKVIAGFIIANGAAAMGRDVTMFFTFWGLNALRKPENVSVKKTLMENMFGFMMPRGTGKLKLSNMNMAGMGTVMMKSIMKQKNVDTLDTLMETATKNGVKLIACTMSMDVMGIKEEELIDGVEYGGVASFLAASERSDATLFI